MSGFEEHKKQNALISKVLAITGDTSDINQHNSY